MNHDAKLGLATRDCLELIYKFSCKQLGLTDFLKACHELHLTLGDAEQHLSKTQTYSPSIENPRSTPTNDASSIAGVESGAQVLEVMHVCGHSNRYISTNPTLVSEEVLYQDRRALAERRCADCLNLDALKKAS